MSKSKSAISRRISSMGNMDNFSRVPKNAKGGVLVTEGEVCCMEAYEKESC